MAAHSRLLKRHANTYVSLMVDDEGPIANPRHLPDDLNALLEVVEALWMSRVARLANGDAEGNNGSALPAFRDIEGLLNGSGNGRREGEVVLEVCTETFGLEGSPNDILQHCRGIFRPGGERMSHGGHLLLHVLDNSLILENGYGSIACLEAGEAATLTLTLVFGQSSKEMLLDGVPDLVMLLSKEDDGATGLYVEAGRGVLDGVRDDLYDLVIADGRLWLEAIVGASRFDELEESLGHGNGFS